ncbi:DUF2304 domain-containing protein [Microterricola viridarii]|uniref:DUF2304 domain-containing protein n=1 Tax=Microterricola viridarii TaxID=412690 RepID=UPI0009E86FA2|nr:DUF2304 domain-containing protein [Microterricola viridarii]
MGGDQLAIKVVLIVVFAVFGIFLMVPGRGVRHTALRRLAMAGLLVVTVLAVIFPGAVNSVANILGVGRGTDLLLYGLIVVFVGNTLIVQRRQRNTERQITALARQLALMQALTPAGNTPGGDNDRDETAGDR